MKNIKLLIQYDGSNYSGWQRQKNGISIQEKIERAIELTTGEKVILNGSGRTDKGVHAKGQVANFLTESTIPSEKFKMALNNRLPYDISIIDSQRVALDFNSKKDAIRKRYRYVIYNKKIRNPLYWNYSYHVSYNLNYQAMVEAAKDFLGTHDFYSFMASKSSVRTTVRTIYKLELSRNDHLISFLIEGNGFLYNMIRIIVGSLIDIGIGRFPSHLVPYMIEARDRKEAGHTAGPQGLYLEQVFYNKNSQNTY